MDSLQALLTGVIAADTDDEHWTLLSNHAYGTYTLCLSAKALAAVDAHRHIDAAIRTLTIRLHEACRLTL